MNSIETLKALTAEVIAESEAKKEARRKADQEEQFQREVSEEKEHFEAAQNIIKHVLDNATAAAGKGAYAAEVYEPLNGEFKLVNRRDAYSNMEVSISGSGYENREMHAHEYTLHGPLNVAVKALIKEGAKVSFYRRGILTSASFKYFMMLNWH